MKKFITRSLLFCLAPLPLLYLLNYVVEQGLKKSHHYFYSEWNDLFNGKINADLIIMGSSRAWVQLSPKILDSVLQMNTYNLGMDASCPDLQFDRLKLYLQHNKKPKYILQEVGFNTTLVRFNDLPGSQQFLPYLNDDAVWAILKNHETTFNIMDRYFPLYRYNNELPIVKEGIKSYMGKGLAPVKYKGYQGQDKVWDSSFHNFRMEHPTGISSPIDSAGLAIFKQYLDFCKEQGIKVIMVYPPVYYESIPLANNKDEFLKVYQEATTTYGIPFYNYMNDSMNYDRNNFYNSQHLNRAAAEIFTLKLANDIRKEMR